MELQAQVKRLRIYLTHSKVERSKNNHAAKNEIVNMKNHFWQKMVFNKFPKRLWDYGLVHQAGILIRITRGKKLRMGIEEVTIQTLNISEWLDFDFYS